MTNLGDIIAKIRYRADGDWYDFWVRAEVPGIPAGLYPVSPTVLVLRVADRAELEAKVDELVVRNQDINGWTMTMVQWDDGTGVSGLNIRM